MRFHRAVLALAAALLILALPVGAQAPYRILVTNDDGVRAPGIAALARALEAVGEVHVIAPAENQSGKGHSLTLTDPVYVDPIRLPDGLTALGVSATPASVVKVAVLALMAERPDLVVSGINRGLNTGTASFVSGTVGAAREAALQGIPAIATSMDVKGGWNDYGLAARATADIAAALKAHPLAAGTFLNVNVPAGTPKGRRVVPPSVKAGIETWTEQKTPRGRRYFWNEFALPEDDVEGTDIHAVVEGFVAITPLRLSDFDEAAAAKLAAVLR
ncbi:MAG: 5'/3'-nucleotidase SurE [Vicinamibacterales bacterium]